MRTQFSLAIVLSSAILLSACQTMVKAPALTTTPSQAEQQFKITGKIGVRTAQQNGSAFYGWTQIGDYFAINLTGAMGIGQTSIQGKPGEVLLSSSKTGTLQASTPEELLFKATGWQAPITSLISWINAQPTKRDAQVSQDTSGRIQSIQEQGWTVTLSYNAQEKLPNKLVLVDTAQQNRVTLTIQSRE